jgi:hypothetical protein
MTHSHVDKYKRYYPPHDLRPYIKVPHRWHNEPIELLPNLEKITHAEALNRISQAPNPNLHCYLRVPDAPAGESAWGALWLDTLQSRAWDGCGLLVIPKHTKTHIPYTYRFALCKHEIKSSPTARPKQGIHDQFCTVCGLDMSYNSGD